MKALDDRPEPSSDPANSPTQAPPGERHAQRRDPDAAHRGCQPAGFSWRYADGMLHPFTAVYKQGDIVLMPFPFTDLSSSKKRPAVVVSPIDSTRAKRMSYWRQSHLHISQTAEDPNGLILATREHPHGCGQTFRLQHG